MIVLAVLIFGFCLWAVFSRHFCDGIVAKHLLSFAAIADMLAILDPANLSAALASLALLTVAMLYWFVKHRTIINKRLDELFH